MKFDIAVWDMLCPVNNICFIHLWESWFLIIFV